MRPVRQDTDRIVERDGTVKFGLFDRPFEDVNLLDAHAFAWPLPRIVKSMRLKEWQAFQISHPRYFLNLALFDARVIGLVQAKVFERRTGTKYLFEKKVPTFDLSPPRTLLDSTYAWEKSGGRMVFRNRLREDRIFIELDLPKTKTSPAMSARFEAHTEGRTPMVVSIPFAKNRGMYSHKCLVPLRGSLTIGDETTDFGDEGCMLIDDHKGYYPRIMRWDWVTSGCYRDGKLVGFNLTRNASIDPARFNENGFWEDGRLHQLPPVTFERSERDGREVWRIRDEGDHVDVRFHVEVDGRVTLNLGLIESRYRGPFGSFEGKLRSFDGEELVVDGMFGMGEDFHLKA